MAKLHELLAVEADLAGISQKICLETRVNFMKNPDRYMGMLTRHEAFDEAAIKESNVIKAIDDTVKSKLDYSASHVIRYLDVVLQKEKTNQVAVADLVVDDVVIGKDLPATFLLGMESKLKKIREDLYQSIPTLQPGVEWVLDESVGANIFKKVHPDEKFRTKKIRKNHVLSPATKEHPAQVEVYTEDERTHRVVTDMWSGMVSTAKKSELLGRVDKLIRAVKKARQTANATKVVKTTIGKEIFDYINGA